MATISNADKQNLTAEQQKQIAALKDQWAAANAANDQAGMDAAHKAAEEIRASAGYSGGAAGNAYNANSVSNGGMTADQMRAYLEDYQKTNYNPNSGWTNGYDTSMNVRSKANKIRQQMQANSDAWHTADANQQKYLHDQNLALAQLLYDYTGQSKKNTWYDEKTGKWYTYNRNVGYGEQLYPEGYAEDAGQYYGYTAEQLKNWANDPGVYYNFVDTRAPSRNVRDESNGFTGEYAQFVNGPYLQLMSRGSHNTPIEVYSNVYGDGFYDDEDAAMMIGQKVQYDANGNPILTPDRLKNNNAMDDYTRQFGSYTQNGVIMPGVLAASRGAGGSGAYSGAVNGVVDANNPLYHGGETQKATGVDPTQGMLDYYENYGQYSQLGGYGTANSGNSGSVGKYEDYINQMYDAALQAQLEQLKASYEQNVSDLDASSVKVDDTYTEQKRQTSGTNAQQNAAWREMANAYGLNSGAIGQAALAQNNQLQSNLNTLESAQAAAQAEIERERALLGQQYQLQINQALAENNYEKAQMLYQEAVRQDELLVQQQQYNANLMLQYAQMAMQQKQYDTDLQLQYAKMANSSGSGGGTVSDSPKTFDTNALYEAIYQSGDSPEMFLLNAANQKAYGYGSDDEYIAQALKGYESWQAQRNNQQIADSVYRGIPANEFASLKNLVQKFTAGNNKEQLNALLSQYADQLSNEQLSELAMLMDTL